MFRIWIAGAALTLAITIPAAAQQRRVPDVLGCGPINGIPNQRIF